MAMPKQELTRELAVRLAAAWHSRKIYAQSSPVWQKTLEGLKGGIEAYFSGHESDELTFALLGEGMAVSGVPIVSGPGPVAKLAAQLKARNIEIISLRRECQPAELETLLAFLSTEAADVSAVQASAWLKERGVDHIQIKHLKLLAGADGLGSFRDVFRIGAQTLRQEFRSASERGSVDMGPIIELAQAMLGLIHSNTPVATLLALRDRDDFTYVHSVNVGMLAGCQAAAMGLPEKEVEEISTAGLLHDIGKTRVPEGILQKRTPTLQEQALLAAHALEGARLLYSSQGANRLPAIVAAEHHRPGAPGGSDSPLLASQLVALADVFDSIRSLRPFDDRHAMRGALAYMFEKLRGRFHPYLLTRFATLCGMFAPGDPVQLATGEVVKIVRLHPESALHPTVEVVDPAVGSLPRGTVLDLSQQKGAAQPAALRLPAAAAFNDLDPRELDALG
jgi:putative nucleotidyltransferase with HDIG domain